MQMQMQSPLIVTGPPGSGKSHWIQAYAKEKRKQLLTCSCRKDRTLREGRQKLHIWGRRREPTLLWLEGADDLTPEAQAFLRRILETHSTDVQFILECRDPAKLQEPIRSRCTIQRIPMPSRAQLTEWIQHTYSSSIHIDEIFDYILPNEYSYRRIRHCLHLQIHEPATWKHVLEKRIEERNQTLVGSDLLAYQQKGMSPELLLQPLLDAHPELLLEYGACLESSGSLWAFLGYSATKHNSALIHS
jgi:hypothetical protein